jgi:hypothetical protein
VDRPVDAFGKQADHWHDPYRDEPGPPWRSSRSAGQPASAIADAGSEVLIVVPAHSGRVPVTSCPGSWVAQTPACRARQRRAYRGLVPINKLPLDRMKSKSLSRARPTKADHASGGSGSTIDGFTESRTPTDPSVIATSTQFTPPDFVLLCQKTHGLSKLATRPPPRRVAGPAQTSAAADERKESSQPAGSDVKTLQAGPVWAGAAARIPSGCSVSQIRRSGQYALKRYDIDRYRPLGRLTDHVKASAASRSRLTESAGISDFSVMRRKVSR